MTKKGIPGLYILNTLRDQEMNGHAYTMTEDLYELCRNANKGLTPAAFADDKAYLMRDGYIQQEGRRVYRQLTWKYESTAAGLLADILSHNKTDAVSVPDEICVGDKTLTAEQREAVAMALNHRLSIVLGGAGTGKTTLIQTMVTHRPDNLSGYVLCAPTGKAARNLTGRTGLTARTVHSALGKRPDDDFLDPVRWTSTGLCIVDEGGMCSLEMLAGLLNKIAPEAHLVLVGDPDQLQSVGAGNVLPDLLELGIPSVTLHICHRQDRDAEALSYNVQNFRHCHSIRDLKFDDSFQFHPMLDDGGTLEWVREKAAAMYSSGVDVQVLSPVRSKGGLSVDSLNRDLQDLVNPVSFENITPDFPNIQLRAGDRVMVTENDRERNVSNGDIGRFDFGLSFRREPCCELWCPDGRIARWGKEDNLRKLTLAYAITIHKSQGSENNVIIVPLSWGFSIMMYRNLIYTAISRAKQQVLLVGSRDALEKALRQSAPPRRSMLVSKTRMAQLNVA